MAQKPYLRLMLSCGQVMALQTVRAACRLLVQLLDADAGLRKCWAAPKTPSDADYDCCWTGVAAAVRKVSCILVSKGLPCKLPGKLAGQWPRCGC